MILQEGVNGFCLGSWPSVAPYPRLGQLIDFFLCGCFSTLASSFFPGFIEWASSPHSFGLMCLFGLKPDSDLPGHLIFGQPLDSRLCSGSLSRLVPLWACGMSRPFLQSPGFLVLRHLCPSRNGGWRFVPLDPWSRSVVLYHWIFGCFQFCS